MPFLHIFHSNFADIIMRGNDNLSKISGKLERVAWPLPENWHGMALLLYITLKANWGTQVWKS